MFAALLSTLPLAAAPAPAAQTADTCGPGPALLVVVTGLKDRSGAIRVRSFGGSPSTYFNKKTALRRTEIPTPQNGPVRICMPVSAPGWYAVDVRHDTNGNGDTDRADGGGASGNPRVTLLDVLLGRKPPAEQVRVSVGQGVTTVPVTVMYLKGGSFRPIGE